MIQIVHLPRNNVHGGITSERRGWPDLAKLPEPFTQGFAVLKAGTFSLAALRPDQPRPRQPCGNICTAPPYVLAVFNAHR